MGKYDSLVDHLEKAPEEKSDYQIKVDKFKATFLATCPDASPAELARCYCEARAEKERIAEIQYDNNLAIEAYSQLLIAAYETHDMHSITLTNGQSVATQVEPFASVKDKDAFRKWVIANHLEKLMSLPYQTMNALTKERLMAGEPEPDGVVVHLKTKVVLR